MNQGKLFEEILKPVNRPNPYPLYSQLRATPVSTQEDGTYVVSTTVCLCQISAPQLDFRFMANFSSGGRCYA
jgi:hypothetical protein